ncbi:MAG: metallophosphoesterase family protein [Mesorhizobium sp.]|nr:MAG: metallophosphoesterase [Mesorhizobium sp.]RWE42516.1 MAG: metallophosphoesterase [Mesorhizobium sp.]TIV71054.1 MAG: metallophosphoesterase family protein [Mesorhizobium sp.]
MMGAAFTVISNPLKTQVLPSELGIDMVVSGHSHVPKIKTVDGALYLNPGSAGHRRFKLPITLATVDIAPDGLQHSSGQLGER